MQTIIGSGGAIGVPLARELSHYTEKIRLVSRNPKAVNNTDEIYPLDVTRLKGLDEAIAGSSTVYVVIGFEYNLKVWQRVWPPFIRAVIEACENNNAKLVFFDNVYLYDKKSIPFMTEDSAVNPPSQKGQVREIVFKSIMDEINKGRLEGLIARSADFYGPVIKGSMLGEMVISNILKGKSPMLFGDIDKVHTYTYTPDAVAAVALLGNTPDAFGQVWHLPTTKEKLSNRQWVNLIAGLSGKKGNVRVLPDWVIRLLGLFMPVMREFPEMLYQYETDYVFDSSKFEKRFNIRATSPEDGMKRTLQMIRNSASL